MLGLGALSEVETHPMRSPGSIRHSPLASCHSSFPTPHAPRLQREPTQEMLPRMA